MPTLKAFYTKGRSNIRHHLDTISVTSHYNKLSKEDFQEYILRRTDELKTKWECRGRVLVYLCFKSKINNGK
mgnify:CR=1 FL=1